MKNIFLITFLCVSFHAFTQSTIHIKYPAASGTVVAVSGTYPVIVTAGTTSPLIRVDTGFINGNNALSTIYDRKKGIDSLVSLIAAKLSIVDTVNTRLRATAGAGMTITGTFPNLTFASTGGSSTDTNHLSDRIDLKLDKLASAYSFRVNNTGSSANVTEVTHRKWGEQTYLGVPTFSAGTSPSSPVNHTYKATQNDDVVEVQMNLTYSTPGATVTVINIPFPAGLPLPSDPTGFSATNDYSSPVVATASTATNSGGVVGVASIRKLGASSYGIVMTAASGSYNTFRLSFRYFTN